MAPSTLRPRTIGDRLLAFATAYDDQSDEAPAELVIPEDLTTLDDEALQSLLDQFVSAGAALYAPDEGVIPDAAGMETLRQLAAGAETLRAAQAERAADAETRATEAAELAAQINPVDETDTPAEGDAPEGEGDGTDAGDEETPEGETPVEGETPAEGDGAEETPESLAASGARQRGMSVSLAAVRSRQTAPRPRSAAAAEPGVRDFITMSPQAMMHAGQAADFSMATEALTRQLASFPEAQFANARRANRHIRQQMGLLTVRKPFDDRLVVTETSSDADVDAAMSYAIDESRLPGGSLVASGGWCAPVETLFDLFEIESRDGIYSLPELGIQRSGIRWAPGPDFSSIFSAVGFSYTADQDEAGTYGVDADGVGDGSAGSKPCYHIECTPFDEADLSFDGLCLTAGLLQRRGFPELIQRVIRGALVAHAHKIGAHLLSAVSAGSTAISLPGSQVGATAPILTAIELQVAHLRATHRTMMNLTMEAVFPFWVHGAIRADLSRRLGVNLLDITDAQIDGWFRQRGVNPQFIYGLNDIATTAASGFTAFPETLDFYLYPAGTWVKGGADIITLDTVYDSTLLGLNDYTALFSEEGWLVAKRGHDSRKVTVPICVDGATHAGVAIDCDGSAGA
jgi:hypothetical protein